MITIKSAREIEGMRQSGAVLAGVHLGLRDLIKPGLSTWEIETFSRNYIESHGGIASQIGFDGYKYATCVSVNYEVAHGIPRQNLSLKQGDIVKVDMCVELNGYQSDSCWTYAVGEISPARQQLMDVTRQALYRGIDQAVVGNRIGDIGAAIQDFTEGEYGYGDVRELIGHGIQPTIHESPAVPNYGQAGQGLRLREGMTITIEPMITTGTWKIASERVPDDSWEYYVTEDGSDCAQYEHTIAITADGPKILTSQDPLLDAKYL
ncbi:type I methionyl aminopeptidase [Lacticaseibacillus brantae]|uniref:Methionine aminopeptidase n=1 Tax=Lacticaseibacillus brantae DSM 23927 TaxID=1423727 RepID=A0A0R2AYM3_9LACO|nr:type I methionyl aminopeptidase [Lacticaseibacillus brantae]KRM72424.1 methionine aminopeptidase [Lacticaseibacillus brantae DSM 23927]